MKAEIVDEYRNINWSYLLRSDLGSGQLTEAKPYLDRIKKIFDVILDNPITDTISSDATAQVENEIKAFLNFLSNEIMSFSDVTQKSIKIKQIKDYEAHLISSLGHFLAYLNANEEKLNISDAKTVIESIRKDWEAERNEISSLKEEVPKILATIENSRSIATELEDKSEVLRTAIARADEWIKKNDQTVELILRSNATDSAKKAREHETFRFAWVNIWLFNRIPKLKDWMQPSINGTFFWILGALFWGLVVMLIVAGFVYLDHKEIDKPVSVGRVLLRVSSVLIPAYFTYFCAQQYLNHRKLYESYRFKDVALQTMVSLRKQITNDSTAQREILLKTVEVLFQEPKIKEDVKYDRQLVLQLLEIMKR